RRGGRGGRRYFVQLSYVDSVTLEHRRVEGQPRSRVGAVRDRILIRMSDRVRVRVVAHPKWRRFWMASVAAALVSGFAACTILLDRSSTQCRTDGDCAQFGSHPFCMEGVCAPSGFAPADCFFGP